MKKKLMTTMVVSMAAMAAMAGDFKLSGSITGLPDGTLLVLSPMSYSNESPVATATIQGGKFSMSGTVPAPMCVNLMVDGSYGHIQLMVDGENATVNATADETKSPDGTPYYHYHEVSIKGSPLTDKLKSLTSVRDSMNLVHDAFEQKYASFFKEQSEAYQKKDTLRMKELLNSETGKQMAADEKTFFDGVEKAYTHVFLSNKDTYWGPLMMLNLFSYMTPQQRPLYDQLADEAKNSYYGKKVYLELYPAGQVGQKVPDFTVKDETGKSHTLKSLLKGKKYMVLDFWASWCGPCRR